MSAAGALPAATHWAARAHEAGRGHPGKMPAGHGGQRDRRQAARTTRAATARGAVSGTGPSSTVAAANRARARARYDARRHLLIAQGRWKPFISAAPARQHVRALMAAGLSLRQISLQSGVPRSVLSRLVYGKDAPGRPPVERIRPHLAAAILAVTTDPDRVTGPSFAAATAAARRLQALTCLGWAPRELAARLGMHTGAVRRIRDGERRRIKAATSRKVAVLYDQIWAQAPPEETKAQRIAAAKARGYARRKGWAPPAAWDDDAITDPAAKPAAGWQRRRVTARNAELAEDATELLAQSCLPEQAATRLGVSRERLEQVLRRHRKQDQARGVLAGPAVRRHPA